MSMRALRRSRSAISAVLLGVLSVLLAVPLVAFAVDPGAVLEGAEGSPLEAYDTSRGWEVTSGGPTSIEMGMGIGGNVTHDQPWGGGASIEVDQVLPGSDLDVRFGRIFTSFEDFRTRLPKVGEYEISDPKFGFRYEETTLGGMPAYKAYGLLRDEVNPDYRRVEHYYIPSGDGGIHVIAKCQVFWTPTWDDNDEPITWEHEWQPVNDQLDGMLASLRFKPLGDGAEAAAAPVPEGTPDAPASSPWRTVTGGALAVAAAAAALVGAAVSSAAQKGAKQDPTKPVGYVLQLSSNRLALSAGESARLTVTAYQVMLDGSTRPAPDAQITISPPEGVSVQPPAGAGSISALVWVTGRFAGGSVLAVQVSSPLGGTSAGVSLESAEETHITMRLEPADKGPLRTDGIDAVTLVAEVVVSASDAVNPAFSAQAANGSIEISSASEWLDLSETVDYGTARAASIQASQPDPSSPVQPPQTAAVKVTAQVGETPLVETVAVPLALLPEMDANPDGVAFALDSGDSADIAVWIDNGAGVQWEFETVWAEGAPVLAATSFEQTAPSTGTLTLTEAASGETDSTRSQTASTLRVVASAEGYEPIERHIKVIVSQEGLFVDFTNADPFTHAFAVQADGSAKPTRIDVRVFVRDAGSGAINPDIELAQQVAFTAPEEEGTVSSAAMKAGGFEVRPAGARPVSPPSAMFDFTLANALPTGGEVVAASVTASLPGRDVAAFSAMVPLRLYGVDTEPFSEAWELELERCRYVIDTYVPAEHRIRLHTLLAERSRTMGAEGLYKMRRSLWSFAYDQIMIEKHEHLDAAWWNEQIEGTLDWISWCGDIALGVASGACLGVVGSIAIGMLKPLLVSAMETWVNGGSIDDWLWAQTGMLAGVAEGALTDPDFLTKLSGDKKAIGWALFIAYYFAKELYNDPNLSVTNAMKNVSRQLRDEGLIRFLQKIAGMKGGGIGDDARTKSAKPDTGTPDAGTPKPTPDAPHAKSPAATPDAKSQAASPDAPHAKPQAVATPAPDAAPAKPKPDAAAQPTPDAPPAKPKPDPATRDADAGKPEQKEPRAKPDKPADKPAEKPTDKPADAPTDTSDPRKTSPEPSKRAKGIADDVAAKTSGGKDLDPATAERIMRDPDAMRELRKNHPEAWKKFHEARSKTYEAHDAQLKKWIEDNVPEADGKQVEVRSVGTPDGVDRDFRAGYVVTDPVTGHQRFIELKKENWAPKSAEIFAKETGGPTDSAGAHKWAKDHQQLATDQYHAESSVDMADQATVYNEKTGQWEKTQVTPNIDMVKQGKSTLLDPDGYGKTYETKVMEAYAEGNKLDAFKQADKAVHSLEGVREGYEKQRYGVKELPPRIEAGMQAIKDVQSGGLTPAQAEARLKDLNFTGGLPDFMEKVSGQFASFKWSRKV